MTPQEALLSLNVTLQDSTYDGNITIQTLYDKANTKLRMEVDECGNAYHLLSVIAAAISQLRPIAKAGNESEKRLISETLNAVLETFNRDMH